MLHKPFHLHQRLSSAICISQVIAGPSYFAVNIRLVKLAYNHLLFPPFSSHSFLLLLS